MPVLPEPSEQSAGSPLYTYAFLPMPDAPLWHFIQQTQGIRGPLQVFSPTGGRIAAAVEPMPDPASLQASDEVLLRSALRHDQVICRLFAQMPLLPLRFGTCFLSAEKLGSHLLAQQAEYEQALAAIGGRAEYCLKGKLSPQPPRIPNPLPAAQPICWPANKPISSNDRPKSGKNRSWRPCSSFGLLPGQCKEGIRSREKSCGFTSCSPLPNGKRQPSSPKPG